MKSQVPHVGPQGKSPRNCMPSVHISTLPVFIGSVVRSTCGHYNDTCVYIWCTCMYVYIVVYIYNYIEREKERDNRNNSRWKQLSCGCGYNWLKKIPDVGKPEPSTITRAMHNKSKILHIGRQMRTKWDTSVESCGPRPPRVGDKYRIKRA